MTTSPNCKINLGLHVVGRRPDGYHDLETIFLPVHDLRDELEIVEGPLAMHQDGIALDNAPDDNLCLRAWRLLHDELGIPPVQIRLKKGIPFGAGLGGGSSDAAFTLKMLNEMFALGLDSTALALRAARLGADCPFFITAEPSFAVGRGEVLEPADGPKGNLDGYFIAIVKPDVAVSTGAAYQQIVCRKPAKCCREVVRQPIDTWKDDLSNDFEGPVFKAHPELADIKQRLYDLGAVYAQMSGSGSALFGIFREEPTGVDKAFSGCFTFTAAL